MAVDNILQVESFDEFNRDYVPVIPENEPEDPPRFDGPRLWLWDYDPPAEGADGCPVFLAIADSEDHAREAVVNHPEVSQLLTNDEFMRLVLGPPTRVIDPAQGAVFVINYRAEDRIEA